MVTMISEENKRLKENNKDLKIECERLEQQY